MNAMAFFGNRKVAIKTVPGARIGNVVHTDAVRSVLKDFDRPVVPLNDAPIVSWIQWAPRQKALIHIAPMTNTVEPRVSIAIECDEVRIWQIGQERFKVVKLRKKARSRILQIQLKECAVVAAYLM